MFTLVTIRAIQCKFEVYVPSSEVVSVKGVIKPRRVRRVGGCGQKPRQTTFASSTFKES